MVISSVNSGTITKREANAGRSNNAASEIVIRTSLHGEANPPEALPRQVASSHRFLRQAEDLRVLNMALDRCLFPSEIRLVWSGVIVSLNLDSMRSAPPIL
jgi:hypothetical protein